MTTPIPWQNNIKLVFQDSTTAAFPSCEFVKTNQVATCDGDDICRECVNDSCTVVVVYRLNETIPADTQDPCNLKTNQLYTWLMTTDGQLNFGEIHDSLEWGAKHLQLSFLRPVWAGGEMIVEADGTIRLNVDSGSFARVIWSLDNYTYPSQARKQMEIKVDAVFNQTLRCRPYQVTSDRIFRKHPDMYKDPTITSMEEKCNKDTPKPYFYIHNSNVCDYRLLGAGEIAAIVLGAVLFFVIIAFIVLLVYLVVRRKRLFAETT